MITPADIPDEVSLDCHAEKQQTVEWCWAACACGIARFLKIKTQPKESDLAGLLTKRKDCGTTPTPKECIVPTSLQAIDTIYDSIGVSRVGPDYPLSIVTALGELIAKRPFEIAFQWNNGGGHVVLVRGFDKSRSQFYVSDPWFGEYNATYQELVNFRFGEISGRWVRTFGRFQLKEKK